MSELIPFQVCISKAPPLQFSSVDDYFICELNNPGNS